MKTIRMMTALIVVGASSVFYSGCAGTGMRKSTGEFIDDAGITTKVKAAFVQDPVVQALDVGVDTFKGNVQLNGFVDTAEQKSRAEEVARGIPGVVSVKNNLSVKGRAVR